MTSSPELKTFASRKFDLINAIVCDPRLRPSTTRVATALLSFANSKTWAIYPSQERVALMVNLKPRMVRTAIAQMVATGWLRIHRTSMRETNQYFFVESNIAAIRDRVERISDEFAAMAGKKVPVTPRSDRQDIAGDDRQDIAGDTGTAVPSNTLRNLLKVTTLSPGQDKKATELTIGQYEDHDADGEGLAQLATQAAQQASPSGTGPSAEDSFGPMGAYVEPNFDRLQLAPKLRTG